MNFLCVDVGGTRIKAGIIPEYNEPDDLKNVPVYSFNTLGWLNKTLPELISADNWAGIINRFSLNPDSYDKICIDVPGPIINGIFDRDDLINENGVPKELLNAFKSNACNKDVYMAKDADAWIIGMERLLQYNSQIEYPAAGIILGTGVGISFLLNPSEVISFEISKEKLNYQALQDVSHSTIWNPWDVHTIIGSRFFSWIKGQRKLSYPEIRNQFTKRIIAFYSSLSAHFERKTNRKIRTVLLGGGNCGYVSIRQLTEASQTNVISLEKIGLMPTIDIVPLIGLREYADKGVKVTHEL